MIVACESCGTKFKVSTEKLKGPVAKVRCSKCKHVFTLNLQGEGSGPKGEKIIVLDSFDEDVAKVAAKGFGEAEKPGVREGTVQQSEEGDGGKVRRHPRPPAKAARVAKKKLLVMVTIPLILVLVAVGGYRYLKGTGDRANSEKSLKKELIKPSVSVLPQTQAYFVENVQGGQMLVVQGEVANEAGTPVSFVLLEGKVIGTNGKVVLTQRFYAGNIMTKEELIHLAIEKIQERMMHREGDNLINVHIKPGEKVPFMVAFYNLPPVDELSDYTIEYVNAETEKPSPSSPQKAQDN